MRKAGKPLLTLELDEHSNAVGYRTRADAFVTSIELKEKKMLHKGIIAEKPLLIDCSPNKPTIRDVAIKIHRSFYESFDYAIVIRKDARQEKKKVGLDYELKENDIIELHTK